MKTVISFCILLTVRTCASYKILAVFPYNGRSHHIFYSALVEELASRKHDVTVVNYFPVKNIPNLQQISLENINTSDTVDIEDHLKTLSNNVFLELFRTYDTAKAFKFMANSNCEKLVTNKDVQRLMSSDVKFDLVIAEQFVTDCGLALAHKLNAPTVGIAAHVLMPWTYSRLGAPNNPSFVPNHFFATGSKPDLLNRIKSTLINAFFNVYYKYVIQSNDIQIVRKVLPETPDLEILGRNMSLIMLNQYFPLTGSRVYGANVIEVGGMHVNGTAELLDEDLANFLKTARNGVVYISFGTVAKNFPRKILDEIMKVLKKSNMNFVWKVDNDTDLDAPNNTILREWLPQPAVLCHPKVVAFLSHSGMLSSSEAMHCGVPTISVPLFGHPKVVAFVTHSGMLSSSEAMHCGVPTISVPLFGHPKVVAFVIHSGMLSSSEAMHCGVPTISVPLFGDQFANAASAKEIGLGVTVDLATLDENILKDALETVLQERFQKRAKQLSNIWRDRPMSPMDTAVYWIEYIARHKGGIENTEMKLQPPTVGLPLYQYLLLDVITVIAFTIVTII